MSENSEMVERVARASFKCWRDHMDIIGRHLDRGRTFEDMGESELAFAFKNARAVIGAMREPTDAMQSALVALLQSRDGISPNDLWQFMIDAALSAKLTP